MNAPPNAVPDEVANLRASLRQQREMIALLEAELTETNRGVVALYSEIEDKSQELRQAGELKSRFLSYMSHEFRTPLGSIRSMARILLDRMDGDLNREQQRQVEFMQTAACELTDLVNDLLDLAKVEAGRITVSPAWFEMVDFFSALRGMFKPILDTTSALLIFDEPGDDLPSLYSDDKKLAQILRNFISNALKFTPQGEVHVSARLRNTNTIVFAVSDTGIGIAPEHHAGLFRDFEQVDSPLQKRYRGTGLGLSLSKKLAELLGGRVWMESAVGKGSIFSVEIPVSIGEAGPPHPAENRKRARKDAPDA